MHKIVLALAAILIASPAFAAPKDNLTALRAAYETARAAYEKKDWPAAKTAFTEAHRQMPQRAGALYNLAIAERNLGNPARALALLNSAAAMGVAFDPANDADFAALKSDPGFAKVVARFAANAKPFCDCTPFFTGTHDPFIAEGIAVDGARVLIASVHTRRIVAIANGRQTDFIATLPDSLSPFGMTVDSARQTLWVSAAAIAQGGTTAKGSALLAFDSETGALKAKYPSPDANALLGDVARGGDGTIYVSDSLGGLYRLAPNATVLSSLSEGFSSPQGMIASADNRWLLVADYAMGLLRLDLKTGTVTTVAVPPNVTTLGIDGLARDGADIVATQNGIAPARILRLHISADGKRLTSIQLLSVNGATSDPSLIASDGHTAYAVGTAQWSSFDDGKSDPVRPTAPWTIVKFK